MNNIEIYQAENGEIEFRGDIQKETIWTNLNQIAKLFGRDKSVISRHIKNIFKSGELDRDSTVAKIATVQIEGNREVIRDIEYYNLDMILSVGYRVDSKEATHFRKWATSILKKYLIDGYAINEKKLLQTKEILNNLKKTINLLSTKNIGFEKEFLELLKDYTKTLILLEKYDKKSIDDFEGVKTEYKLSYDEVKDVLKNLKKELNETELFANEKAGELKGIIDNIYQTFSGYELYPSIEDKAIFYNQRPPF